MLRLLWTVIALLSMSPAASAQAPPNVFNSDVHICSGRPWIDVTCNGADPTGVADSTSAIQTTINAAVSNDWPVMFPAGTFKVTSKITVEYGGQAANGPQIIAQAAFLDGRAVASGNVFAIQCSGGTTASPVVCNHFGIQGWLTIMGSGAGYVVTIGKTDFSDQHNGARIEHLVVTNAGAGGAIQANYVSDADMWLSGSTQGGSSSVGAVALEQVQTSRIGGYGSALGASAPALLIENGASVGNGFVGFGYDPNSNTCISITAAAAVRNAWVAPYLSCPTAINATGSATSNALIGPNFAGPNRGPLSTGIAIIGRGSLHRYIAPTAATYTAAGSDDGTIISAANGTGAGVGWGGNSAAGASIAVTLPDPAAVGAGWTIGFVNDNNKAVIATTSAGKILAGGLQLGTLTLGPGNFEFVALKSDGANFRVETSTTNTRQLNGIDTAHFPANWVFLPGPGYAATQADNGSVLSSRLVGGTLTVNLPSISGLSPGWTIGLAADPNDPITLAVAASGTPGSILMADGSQVTSYQFTVNSVQTFQFDGAAFRHVTSSGQTIAQVGRFTDNRTAALTSDGATIQAMTQGGATAQAIYNETVMSGSATAFNAYDAVRGSSIAPASSTVNIVSGIAGYVRNTTVPVGQRTQTAAVNAIGDCEVNGSQCWGFNSLLSDNTSISNTGVTASTGKFLYNEFDLNITSPLTQGAALQIGGTALPVNQTLNINGFAVQKLWGAGGVGTGTSLFATGIIAADGCCAVGLTLGAVNANNQPNTGSLAQYFNYRDSNNILQNVTLQAGGGGAGEGFLGVGGSNGGTVAGFTGLEAGGIGALLFQGDIGMAKAGAGPVGPGSGYLKLEALPGSTAGTCKLVAFAGTSSAGTLIADNIGGGC